MMKRILSTVGFSLLLVLPASAQFGVGGNRKKAASFQELNEQAKKLQGEGGLDDMAKLQQMMGGAGGLGDMAKLQEMWGDTLNNPETLKQIEQMSGEWKEAMDAMAKMSPEQLQKQMEDAMQMMQNGDMMKKMIENMDKDTLISTLEGYGMIPKEEVEKMKKDPEYLDQKLEESLEQMSELFKDPEVLNAATNTIAGLKDLYENPDKIADVMKDLLGDFESDEEIEKARQLLLKDPDIGYPELKEEFDTDEMREILNDPIKWRETVKEGQEMLKKGRGMLKEGAGVGEL